MRIGPQPPNADVWMVNLLIDQINNDPQLAGDHRQISYQTAPTP
jgi:hypothetical protein